MQVVDRRMVGEISRLHSLTSPPWGGTSTHRTLTFRRDRYQVAPAVKIKLEARDADAVRHTVIAQTDNQLRIRFA